MKTNKMCSRSLAFLVSLILIIGCVFLFLPNKANVAEAAIGENKITTRLEGMLNGTLQKQEDGSVTFNGQELASAAENLSQMYVILQGAGGAGSYYPGVVIGGSNVNTYNGGASGAFCLVKIDFNLGSAFSLNSGFGGSVKNAHRKGANTYIAFKNENIIACAGENGSEDKSYADGGIIKNNTSSSAMSIEFKRDGRDGGHRRPITPGDASTAFTISMYKNGKLTTKFFNHYVGGLSQVMGGSGGGASPYGRGGNGGYAEYPLDFEVPAEDGKGYGAGGGGALILTDHQYGGNGGDGHIEILG